jgi:hypothetical protein
LQRLGAFNALLAHTPWKLRPEHVELLMRRDDSWSQVRFLQTRTRRRWLPRRFLMLMMAPSVWLLAVVVVHVALEAMFVTLCVCRRNCWMQSLFSRR